MNKQIFGFAFFLASLLAACGGAGSGGAMQVPALKANQHAPATAAPSAGAASPIPAQTARASDSFVDAIGVNVHLSYGGTAYTTKWTQIQSLLISSGIRHIRDGVVASPPTSYTQHLSALGSAGIKFDLIGSVGQAAAAVQGYPALVSGIESFEGANEYDTSGDANWVSDLRAFQSVFYSTVKAMPGAYPVLAPSLTSEEDSLALGNLAANENDGNIHVYFDGYNPGTLGWGDSFPGFGVYGSLAYNEAFAQHNSPGLPIIATETGYDDLAKDEGHVSAAIKVRYTLRTLLTFWNAGIVRTYLYELADGGDGVGVDQYGLLTASAGVKPAYTGVAALIGVLADPGATFTPAPLAYALNGASATVQQTLLGKRNGSYVLALWNEVPSWNTATSSVITVASQNVTLTFNAAPSKISAQTFGDAGALAATKISAGSNNSYTLPINDHVTLVTIAP